MELTRWPHQVKGVADVLAAFADGERSVCLTSPTGGGKSLMMQDLAQHYLTAGKRVVFYCNRRTLVEQISQSLMEAGMYHGIRADGYEDERDHPFQVSSVQTENARTIKRDQWKIHAANLAIFDEGHLMNNPTGQELIKRHIEQDCKIVLVTATPLGMADIADKLIVAGTNSELRQCGALVPAVHYACDEPNLAAFKKLRKFKGAVTEGEDLSASQQKTAMMTPGIMGRVWKWYERLNPQRKPALLFGPGVEEALWFAEQFTAKGVPAAHIDGEDVWIAGTWYRSDLGARKAVKDGSRDGSIKVVTNRYVLREGADWPWIEHIILAFVVGALDTYLQTCGRGLRASPATGKTQLTIQDHGGAWWRHGSINSDREWKLECTNAMMYGLRADRLRNKDKNGDKEPFACPQCGRIWAGGGKCNPAKGGCGFILSKTRISRPVVSTDGTLQEMVGDIFKPRRICTRPNGIQLWEKMYYRSLKGKGSRTFQAAFALFAYENRWAWPDPLWPLMPIEQVDQFRLVADVPRERLR